MDRIELMEKLQDFRAECEKRGYPLHDMCLKEAYPGDISTSYAVRVAIEWFKDMGGSRSRALDILIDALWDTTDVETRKNIFAIDVRDGAERLDCSPETSSTLVTSDSYYA